MGIPARAHIYTVVLALCLSACGEGILDRSYTDDDYADTDPQPALEQDAGLPDGIIEPDAGVGSPDSSLPAPDATDNAGQPPWTNCPRVIVTKHDAARVRPTPDTSSAPLKHLLVGSVVKVLAVFKGQEVNGVDTWFEIKTGTVTGFVFKKQVACTTKAIPKFSGFYLPFYCGKKVKVTQGNKTSFTHNGTSAYAFDFSLGVGTKMRAMAPGTVVHVYKKTKPGDPCYSGGGPSCISKANVVWIRHSDGSRTIYAHLSTVSVSLNQKVSQGQGIGKSGSSGYSTGPHAHIGRMKSCCQTIPLKFKDVGGTGVPKTGDYVVSGNCPG